MSKYGSELNSAPEEASKSNTKSKRKITFGTSKGCKSDLFYSRQQYSGPSSHSKFHSSVEKGTWKCAHKVVTNVMIFMLML